VAKQHRKQEGSGDPETQQREIRRSDAADYTGASKREVSAAGECGHEPE
jgi:hypothetical protein